jgi:hypothetical protein
MKKSLPWLAVLAIIILVFGTIYTVVQQSQRMDANYPQIQIAEDTAAALNQGVKPNTFVQDKVNINASLAPFVIVYNKYGHLVTGSGYLNGKVPTIPYGVLAAANGQTYNFVTWQPESGIRIATVSVAANNYYVLSGRSLTEVEKNETKSLQLSMLGGIASLVVLAMVFMLTRKEL